MTKNVTVFIETVEGETRQTTNISLEGATELECVMAMQSIFKVMGVETSIAEMLDDYIKIGQAYDEVIRARTTPDPIEKTSSKPLPLRYEEEAIVDEGITEDKLEEIEIKETVEGTIAEAPGETEEVNETEIALDGPKDVVEEANTPQKQVKLSGQTAMAHAFAKSNLLHALRSNKSNTEAEETPSFFKTGVKETPVGNRYQCRLHCEGCGLKKTYYINPNTPHVYCIQCQKVHNVRPAKKSGYLIPDAMHNFFVAGSFIGEDEQ